MVDSPAVFTSLLEALADNGGPTPTHELRSGSLGVNTGNNDVCPEHDQRGETRRANGDNCDIGAFELIVQAAQDDDDSDDDDSGGGSLPPLWMGLFLVLFGVLRNRGALR